MIGFLTRRIRRGARGNILLALLVILIVSSLILITTAATLAGIAKTQHDRDFALAQQAADAAVNDALLWLNDQDYTNGLGDYDTSLLPTPTSPRNGDLANIHWTWAVESTLPGDSGYTLKITAGRSDGSFTRTFHADLTGTDILPGGAVYLADGHPRYILDAQHGAGFSTGLFANTDLVLGPGTTVDSYSGTTTGTGQGKVASNGTVSLADGVTPDGVVLYNAEAQPYRERCVGTPCQTVPIDMEPIALGVTDGCTAGTPGCTLPSAFITAQCASSPQTPWVASEHLSGGVAVLSATDNNACYSSMTFDVNTNVTTSVAVYVTGDISVAPGVKVNTTSANATPDPTNLAIYSKGAHVTLGGGATSGADTRAAWMLWAPDADCAGDAGYTQVFGAMICDRISTQGNWKFHVSQQAMATPNSNPNRTRAWALTRFVSN